MFFEEEKKVQKMPLKLLRSIIQSGNDAFSGFNVGKAAATLKEDVERRVEALWKRDRADKAADPAIDTTAASSTMSAPATPSPASSPSAGETPSPPSSKAEPQLSFCCSAILRKRAASSCRPRSCAW